MPEVNEEIEKAEARLKAVKAEIKTAEARLETVKAAYDRIKIDSAACVDLRNLVAGYHERTIKFKDLEPIDKKLADFEKRIAQLEKKK